MRPIKNKKAIKAMNDFEKWMVKKVKSIHYSDTKAMSEAYHKVYQANVD